MITIAYFTNRKDPKFQWFCDSLVNQLAVAPAFDLEVLFIDALAWGEPKPEADGVKPQFCLNPDRYVQIAEAVRGRFNYTLLPPKPNVWQGPFRLTSKDWFAASNARNTALIAAQGNYFIGVDDLTVLMPGWLPNALHAVANGYCVCGSYRKDREMVVENGILRSSTPHSTDSRWPQGADGIVPASGSWLYGCSFGLPLNLALKVNGFDERCDGAGAEDYDFGIRAGRAGGQFFYNRNMLTVESEEGHHLDATLPRQSKLVTPDRLPNGYQGNPMSDHVMLNQLILGDRIHTLGTPDLTKLRSIYSSTGQFPIPTEPSVDWRDGTPLSSY